MKSFNYTVTDEVGIHARPAGLLVKAAKGFNSKAVMTCNGKSADLTRLMAIMALGVKCGMEVTVEVEGEDEDAMAASLEEFFKANV